MKFNVVTIFPDFVEGAMSYGVVGRALRRSLVELNLVNPRRFTSDVHQSVDDRPFGGGDGMLMLAEPLKRAMEFLGESRGHVAFLSPHGVKWSEERLGQWLADHREITLICGRYGGVDQRFIEKYVDEEISLGDFVLSGGEVAALAVMDSLIRRHPGVLGNPSSPEQESFQNSLLEPPQFTRPREWEGVMAPEVLLSGNHRDIQAWRERWALLKTAQLRPDLLEDSQRDLLEEARREALKMGEKELLSCGLKRSELEGSL